NSHNQYLIIAGQAGTEGGSPSGPAWNTLWAWDGEPNDAPQEVSGAIGSAQPSTALPGDLQAFHSDEGGDWEGIAAMPDPLTPGATVRLMMDQGFDYLYDDSTENKKGPPFVSKGRTDVFHLSGRVGTVASLTGAGAFPDQAANTIGKPQKFTVTNGGAGPGYIGQGHRTGAPADAFPLTPGAPGGAAPPPPSPAGPPPPPGATPRRAAPPG